MSPRTAGSDITCLCSARLITCRAAKVGELPLSQTAATRAACKDVVNAAQSLFFGLIISYFWVNLPRCTKQQPLFTSAAPCWTPGDSQQPSFLTGPGGLEEAAGLAGGPPRRELRRLGSPAGRQAHQAVREPRPGGRHQDFLVGQQNLVAVNVKQKQETREERLICIKAALYS